MASKVALQSLSDQQKEEDRILIDRKNQVQKEINQAKLSLKGYQDAISERERGIVRKIHKLAIWRKGFPNLMQI